MISVCLATYNGSKFILPQVLSILNQLSSKDEIIVSDNGSEDDTIKLLSNLNDNRIKILTEPIPGIIPNFSNALSHACGDIIFLSDQDDLWMPNKILKVSELLLSADLVLHDALIVNEDQKIVMDSLFHFNATRIGFFTNLLRNGYVGCCMAFHRKILEHALPIPSNIGMHDWWIGLVAEKYFKVRHLHLPLIKYRRHNNNASNTSLKSNFSYIKRIIWRLNILLNLRRLMVT